MGRISAYLTLAIILCCGVWSETALATLKQPDITRIERTPTYDELKIELVKAVNNLDAELHTSASIKLRSQLTAHTTEMLRLERTYKQARKAGAAPSDLDAMVDAYAACVDGIVASSRDLTAVIQPHQQQIETVLNKLVRTDLKRAQQEQEEIAQLLQPLARTLSLEPDAVQAYVTVVNLRQIAIDVRESHGEAITAAVRWQELTTTVRDLLNRKSQE